MGIGVSFYIRNLVAKDMRQRVTSARRRGESLAIPESAVEIAHDYPGTNFIGDDLRNRLFAEATQAGVPTELGVKHDKRH